MIDKVLKNIQVEKTRREIMAGALDQMEHEWLTCVSITHPSLVHQ